MIAIANYYRKKANANGATLTAKSAKAGAVTLIQRFSSTAMEVSTLMCTCTSFSLMEPMNSGSRGGP